MEFRNLYDHGFVRVAAATLPITMVQPQVNAEAILAASGPDRDMPLDLTGIRHGTNSAWFGPAGTTTSDGQEWRYRAAHQPPGRRHGRAEDGGYGCRAAVC